MIINKILYRQRLNNAKEIKKTILLKEKENKNEWEKLKIKTCKQQNISTHKKNSHQSLTNFIYTCYESINNCYIKDN